MVRICLKECLLLYLVGGGTYSTILDTTYVTHRRRHLRLNIYLTSEFIQLVKFKNTSAVRTKSKSLCDDSAAYVKQKKMRQM